MAEGGQPRPVQDVGQDYTFRNVELLKNETLGNGSYGAVCKAKCDELICAAKLLYPVLFEMQPQAPVPGKEHRQPFRRFELECRFLSRINHPNIVQYLGTYRDPDTNAPVLLMELMDESLTHFLESSSGPIPCHVQVNLCYDIAQALAFLHSNGIIHRDLSSNNVLLIAGSRAKVTDFGMSKFADIAATRLATMTLCPGTPGFMSPEALNEPPVYSEKLDSFSLGVVMVQVVTRQFPTPTNRFQTREVFIDPRYPTRTVQAQVPIPEVERRHAHISLVDPTHPLLPIALHCLKDEDVERPSSQQLCQTLGALKETATYEQSSQRDNDELLRAKDKLILTQTQAQQFNDKETVNHELTMRLEQATCDNLVLQREAEAKEGQLKRLNQQVESNEETIATLQHSITQREREVSEIQWTVRETPVSVKKVDLAWKSLPKPPIGTDMTLGSSAVDGNKAYFRCAHKKFVEYNYETKQWCELPAPPINGFTIVCVDHILTGVGGWEYKRFAESYTYSNKVYSLLDKKWVNHFPAMKGKRKEPVAVYANHILVVAGRVGNDDESVSMVEVLNTRTKQWSTASSLPIKRYQASVVAFCGDHVCIAGSSQPDTRYSMLKCSRLALIASTQELQTNVWEEVACLPGSACSSLAAVNGHLLLIGGHDSQRKPTADIHQYNPTTDSWEVISQMSVASRHFRVAVLAGNKIMTVGRGGPDSNNYQAEIATFE